MKLAEEYQKFVVTRFARFMKLSDIVEEFIVEFEEEIPAIIGKPSAFKSTQTRILSARFRRLNITHSQFPEKHRALFNEERDKFLSEYRETTLHIPDNVIRELESLYGLTRELAFEQRESKYITIALQILKTIIACNAANAQENAVDITPEDVMQLTNTAKTLTRQVKKESRQLANTTNQN